MARKKNQPIRILTEKELKSTIESVPEERRALASNVVSELIWMSGMLDTLKNKADEIGPLDFFVQGEQSMMLDIWGMTKSKNGLIVENANVQPASFALLFEVDGDTTGRKYVLYNCSATRPGINANTKSETTDPDTQTSTITVSPMADGTIKAHTADDATTATLNGWYTSVTLPTDAA